MTIQKMAIYCLTDIALAYSFTESEYIHEIGSGYIENYLARPGAPQGDEDFGFVSTFHKSKVFVDTRGGFPYPQYVNEKECRLKTILRPNFRKTSKKNGKEIRGTRAFQEGLFRNGIPALILEPIIRVSSRTCRP